MAAAPVEQTLILAALFFAAAVLYASVGHAGASGYLAAMALVGVAPTVMRPTALVMNIVVATIVVARFSVTRQMPLREVAPFVVASVPLAFVGGTITLATDVYKPLVGLVLLGAAGRLWWTATRYAGTGEVRVPVLPAVGIGAVIGFLSGLTGTGGGIFLTPILLFFAWSPPRPAAAISAGFILANSAAGLAGNLATVGSLPTELALWVPVVAIGGLIGSELGARRLSPIGLRRALALVLVVAGLKLIFLG